MRQPQRRELWLAVALLLLALLETAVAQWGFDCRLPWMVTDPSCRAGRPVPPVTSGPAPRRG